MSYQRCAEGKVAVAERLLLCREPGLRTATSSHISCDDTCDTTTCRTMPRQLAEFVTAKSTPSASKYSMTGTRPPSVAANSAGTRYCFTCSHSPRHRSGHRGGRQQPNSPDVRALNACCRQTPYTVARTLSSSRTHAVPLASTRYAAISSVSSWQARVRGD